MYWFFENEDSRNCTNYREITLLRIPGEIYSKVLGKRVYVTVGEASKWSGADFAKSAETLTSPSLFIRFSRDMRNMPNECCADLEKAYNRVLRGKLLVVM